MTVVRSLAAVAAGCAVFLGFTRAVDPNSFWSTLAVTILAAILAGYLTAWIAGRREIPHASAVGLLMILMSITSMRQSGSTRPGPFEITVAGCGPMATLVGAALRLLTKRRP